MSTATLTSPAASSSSSPHQIHLFEAPVTTSTNTNSNKDVAAALKAAAAAAAAVRENNNSNNNKPAPASSNNTTITHAQIAGLYELEQTIGQGHFAVVKSARHLFSGERVAIKIIDKQKLDPISREHLFQEVRCMKLVQHPNVVRLYEVIDSPTKLYLIQELGDGGDMYDYIMKHPGGLNEERARRFFSQIVRAVKYCHDLRVVHRDLKPENVVFFAQTGQVKLTDFGFSNVYSPEARLLTSCGSLAYSAPEILLGDSYLAPPVDVWSLGVILYMLVTGRAPFCEQNDSETLTMILDCKFFLPETLTAACRDLIQRMIVRAPEQRISLADICTHEWLTARLSPYHHQHHKSDYCSCYYLGDEDMMIPTGKSSLLESNNESSDDNRSLRTSTRRSSKRSSSGGSCASLTNGGNSTTTVATKPVKANEDNNNPIAAATTTTSTKSNDDDDLNPIVKRENLSEKDNKEVLKIMVNGSIATEEEIIRALDEDKYNYVTATYYLLAERLLKKEYLKRKRQKFKNNNKKKKAPANAATTTETSTESASATSSAIDENATNNENTSNGLLLNATGGENNRGVLKSIQETAGSNSSCSGGEAKPISMASSTLSKNTFSNMMKMQRSLLQRQKDARMAVTEIDEEAEEEDPKRRRVNNDMLEEEEEDEDDGILEEEEEEDEDEIEAEDEADDSGGEEDDTAAISNNQAAINNNKLLTNIIEDDEEHSEIHASSLLSNRAAFAPGQSNSRRSSRGAALGADSMISSLTIPEEVDELDSSSAAANAAAAAAAVADLASHRHHFEVTHIKVNEVTYPNTATTATTNGNQEEESAAGFSLNLDESSGQTRRVSVKINEMLVEESKAAGAESSHDSIGGVSATTTTQAQPQFKKSGRSSSLHNHHHHHNHHNPHHQYSRVSSSAETSDSDQDAKFVGLKQDLILAGHHDWNRSASSRSRNKIRSSEQRGGYQSSSTNPASLNASQESQSYRPLSLNDRGGVVNGSGDVSVAATIEPIYHNHHPTSITRARSLAEAPASYKASQQQQQSSGALSVEHRQANMSQMSISSQLSKNSSTAAAVRQHQHHAPPPPTHQTMSAMLSGVHNSSSSVPTPRESLVFFRGDEKPIAKILLQQHSVTKPHHHQDALQLENVEEVTPDNSVSSIVLPPSPTPRLQQQQQQPSQALNNLSASIPTPTSLSEAVIKQKLDSMLRTGNNESYSNAINGIINETPKTNNNTPKQTQLSSTSNTGQTNLNGTPKTPKTPKSINNKNSEKQQSDNDYDMVYDHDDDGVDEININAITPMATPAIEASNNKPSNETKTPTKLNTTTPPRSTPSPVDVANSSKKPMSASIVVVDASPKSRSESNNNKLNKQQHSSARSAKSEEKKTKSTTAFSSKRIGVKEARVEPDSMHHHFSCVKCCTIL